jgi:hypothetical protein
MIILADVESTAEKCKRARAHHPYVVGGGGGGVDRHSSQPSASSARRILATDTHKHTRELPAYDCDRRTPEHQVVPAAARRTSSSGHFASALANGTFLLESGARGPSRGRGGRHRKIRGTCVFVSSSLAGRRFVGAGRGGQMDACEIVNRISLLKAQRAPGKWNPCQGFPK